METRRLGCGKETKCVQGKEWLINIKHSFSCFFYRHHTYSFCVWDFMRFYHHENKCMSQRIYFMHRINCRQKIVILKKKDSKGRRGDEKCIPDVNKPKFHKFVPEWYEDPFVSGSCTENVKQKNSFDTSHANILCAKWTKTNSNGKAALRWI